MPFDFSKYQKKEETKKSEAIEPPKPIIRIIPKKNLPVKDIEIKKIEPETSLNKINFNALANTSDFKRLIYLGITGESWRGTNKGLEISLNSKLKKLNGSD